MDYLLEKNKADVIQEKLQQIGALSLFIIKHQERISKDEICRLYLDLPANDNDGLPRN